MKLENQVCSLELAQKLKNLGVRQESLFFWVKGDSFVGKCPDCQKAGGLIPECAYCGGTGKDEKKYNYYLYPAKECWEDDRIKDCSAFTVAELGEILPWKIEREQDDCAEYKSDLELVFVKGPSNHEIKHRVLYCEEEVSIYRGGVFDSGFFDNEADARASMLIYLLENKLITL